MGEVTKPGNSALSHPSPIFSSKIQTSYSPKGQTPPRSPSGERSFGRTLSPK